MTQQDTLDFLLAFALGVVAGAGATRLLRTRPMTRWERVRAELGPYRAMLRTRAERAREGFADGLRASVEIGDVIGDAGRAAIRGAGWATSS